MKKNSCFRLLAAVLTVPLTLASCSTGSVPAAHGVVNNPDGSVTYQGKTYTPEQMQARAAELDAQFKAATDARLATLKAQSAGSAGLGAQEVFSSAVSRKPVTFKLTTGYNDDCFYLNLAVLKINPLSALGTAQYVSANSTKVMWWRVKGYATLNTVVANNEYTDLNASCVSASGFFGGGRVEQGRSDFRVWEPPAVASDVALFEPTVKPTYGVIRTGETDYANQGYTRAVSYKKQETAVGVAPTYWSRSY